MRAQGGLTDSVCSVEKGLLCSNSLEVANSQVSQLLKAQAAVLAPALITHHVSVEVKNVKTRNRRS